LENEILARRRTNKKEEEEKITKMENKAVRQEKKGYSFDYSKVILLKIMVFWFVCLFVFSKIII